jgi:hypothetical protein
VRERDLSAMEIVFEALQRTKIGLVDKKPSMMFGHQRNGRKLITRHTRFFS